MSPRLIQTFFDCCLTLKTDALRKRDETLITVPCWWDGTEERYLNSSAYSFCFVVLFSCCFCCFVVMLLCCYVGMLLFIVCYLLFLTLYIA